MIADLGNEFQIDRLLAYAGLGVGSYIIEASPDGVSWEHPLRVKQDTWGNVEWRAGSLNGFPARWIRVFVEAPGLSLGELAVFSGGKTLTPLSVTTVSGAPLHAATESVPGLSHPLFDEPSSAVFTPGKSSGTYFDEVYFARAGLEIARGGSDPETSHPPLAKLFSALGIVLFGPSPFGWRFFFALAGVLTVPAAFFLARRLLGSGPALAAGLIFCLDFMRVVQSRIATPDVFVLLFTLCALLFMHAALRSPRPAPWMLAAGLCMGAGGACKWNGLFAAPAIGVFFVIVLIGRKRYVRDIALGFLCLVLPPAAVYLASYLPWLLRGEPLAAVISAQRAMFSYHAGLSQTHAYSSPWWQWPLVIRPVWIYAGAADIPAGMVRSVASFGDPVVWWPAGIAVIIMAVLAVKKRDLDAAFLAVAFACLYFPWVVSPRKLTFIYHYLPCVPFMIVALVKAGGMAVEWMRRAPMGEDGLRRPRPWSAAAKPSRAVPRGALSRAAPIAARAYVGLIAVLFAAFAPLLYGIMIPRGWVRLLSWLPSWTFWR